MAIPLDAIDAPAVKKSLTIEYWQMGAEEATIIEGYIETDDYLFVPREFGLSYCHRCGIDIEDDTSPGFDAVFPKVPNPRDYQVEPLQLISDCFGDYYDFLFRARTGWGKTIGALIFAARLGRTTLILVDQENLKDQWIESLVNHFGFAVEDVGIIQGNKCRYEGKAVTVAMVQTLSQRQYPQEVYDYFGLVIVDEVHVIGAPTFSRNLFDFTASYRLGVSATPRRRDALQKLIEAHLGRVRVYVEDAHDKSAVYIAEHPGVYSAYANRSPKIGRFITEVAGDSARNLLVAEAACYLYDTGRDILVPSDRIEQLNELMALCYYLGIPEDQMGVYAGYNLVYRYEKDAVPARRPQNLIKYDGTAGFFSKVEPTADNPSGIVLWPPGYYYTPVALNLISKRVNKKRLQEIKTTASIIFATYGKFSKGVDEPRLSGGVDATPRSQAEQEHGRILRKMDGKLKPIWITIADTGSYRSLFSLLGRLEGYIKNNAVIRKWSLEKGRTVCDLKQLKTGLKEQIADLKSSQIETSSDGQSTLVTKKEAIMRELQPVTGTTRKVVRRNSRTVF